MLGRVLHRSINQHRSSKHLGRLRQLRRLAKQTIALGLEQVVYIPFNYKTINL